MKEYFEKIYSKTKNEFNTLLEEKITKNEKTFIVTANPETLMIAEENSDFKKCLLDEKTTIVPDGVGVVKGAKMLGLEMPETIPGVELCSKIFEVCNKQKKSVYFLGAKKEVLDLLIEKVKKDYPDLVIAGYENGYVEDKEKAYEEIKKVKPDVVLVAIGIPYQELLIYKNLNDFDKGIFMGVGGSFDVLSGSKKRAPKIFIKLKLEWLYRITTEPKRLKRFFKSNVKYLFIIRKEKKEKK